MKTQALPLVKNASTFKLHIPEEVEAKIRYICNMIHDVEWSGILFYKYTGSLDDSSFEATCVDLYMMDIGSSAYTEFRESTDILRYRMEHDLLKSDIQEGLIHSHNNMAAYFSNTDESTLVEEGTNCNHFLSLIVNNAGNYVARITRKLVTESIIEANIHYNETQYYYSYNGEKKTLKEDEHREETVKEDQKTQKIEYFDLIIDKQDTTNNFMEIDTRISDIRKQKSNQYQKPSKSTAKTFTQDDHYYKYPINSHYYDDYEDWFNGNHRVGSLFDDNTNTYPTNDFTKEKPAIEPELDEVESLPLFLVEEFDDKIVEEVAAQLLTGSIILNKKSIDINNWVTKMDLVYEKRFGKIDSFDTDSKSQNKDTKRFLEWVEGMVAFLLFTEDKQLLSRLNSLDEGILYSADDTAEILAFNLVEYLSKLPESNVKQHIINELLTYLPNDAINYIGNTL